MSDENLKLRTASESVGWMNSVGPLSESPKPPSEGRTCEFCQQPEGDVPSMLDVCPSCWNKANDGSGWIDRWRQADEERRSALLTVCCLQSALDEATAILRGVVKSRALENQEGLRGILLLAIQRFLGEQKGDAQ